MLDRTAVAVMILAIALSANVIRAADDAVTPVRMIAVWPDLAPGETTKHEGDTLGRGQTEKPPTTRIANITRPMLEVYEPAPEKKNGSAVIIFPGGAYAYVVRDKEGAEPARWLNDLGVTAFVLRYRTKDSKSSPTWLRPLQDAQRALSLIRANSTKWKLDPKRIGIMGFSAGGSLAR